MDTLDTPTKPPESIATNYDLCIICQTITKLKLHKGTPDGFNSIRNAVDIRNCEISKRIKSIERPLNEVSAKWHNPCLASFTSTHNLSRVKEAVKRRSGDDESTSEISGPSTKKRVRRCIETDKSWSGCIICRKSRGTLSEMKSHTTEMSLKHAATVKQDEAMLIRIDNQDLVMKKCKYHRKCLKSYTYIRPYDTVHTPEVSKNEIFEKCFAQLCRELKIRVLDRNEILKLTAIRDRYCVLLSRQNVESSYKSASIKEKLQSFFGEQLLYHRPSKVSQSELVLSQVTRISRLEEVICTMDTANEAAYINETREVGNDESTILYQAASILRLELAECNGVESWPPNPDDISNDVVENVVGSQLKTFIHWLTTTRKSFENQDEEGSNYTRVMSICQDILFASSRGHKLTPKHIGIAIALYHSDRHSKTLNILNKFGHCASRETVYRMLAAVSECQQQMDDEVVIPTNISNGLFTQIAADNNDLSEETLDGKNTTHCTNMIIIQHPSENYILPEGQFGFDVSSVSKRKKSVKSKRNVLKAYMKPGKHSMPNETCRMDLNTLQTIRLTPVTASNLETAWIETRLLPTKLASLSVHEDLGQRVPAWSGFNAKSSECTPLKSIIGYCPVIDASPTKDDVVYTIMDLARRITRKIGQTHTILVLDQAIYCKAFAISMHKQEEFSDMIIRLGGFHILLAFLAVIGKRYACSGLEDIFIESGVIAEGSVSAVMSGKAYNRAIRAHKIMFEALHRVLDHTMGMEKTSEVVEEKTKQVYTAFKDNNEDDIPKLVSELTEAVESIEDKRKSFLKDESSPNASYWSEYLCMVNTLLQFVRAERTGNWQLHLASFAAMLPYFFAYDRHNYARFGCVYLAQMLRLPETAPDVYDQFQKGNSVVARTTNKFSQVSVDLSLEQTLNKESKTSGGIIGISLQHETVHGWIQTAHYRASVSNSVKCMAGIENQSSEHPDCGTVRTQKDEDDVVAVLTQINESTNPFEKSSDLPLVNLKSGSVASEDMTRDIENAKLIGEEAMKSFVENRLNKGCGFYEPLKRNNLKTFASQKKKVIKGASDTKILNDDRELFSRLVIIAQIRKFDLKQLFTYELTSVPLSIATSDGSMRKTQKSVLMKVLESQVTTDDTFANDKETCVVFDMMAEIHSSKPIAQESTTFGEYANKFISRLKAKSWKAGRIDVVCDRYDHTESIKEVERKRRVGHSATSHVQINRVNTPMPKQWQKYMTDSRNKADIANFICGVLTTTPDLLQPDQEMFIAGTNIADGQNCVRIDNGNAVQIIDRLGCSHEEADTRMLLHAKDAFDCGFKKVVIHSPDTDVMVLGVSNARHFPGQLYFASGTGAKKKTISLSDISNSYTPGVTDNIMAMHAITGCDTTSSFFGIGKTCAMERLIENDTILENFGTEFTTTPETMLNAEKFVANCYSRTEKFIDINRCRYVLQFIPTTM